jgi:hypothetical protein
VFFDHPLKVGPRLFSELLDLKSRCGRSPAFRIRPFASVRVWARGTRSGLRAEFLGFTSSCKVEFRVRAHELAAD